MPHIHRLPHILEDHRPRSPRLRRGSILLVAVWCIGSWWAALHLGDEPPPGSEPVTPQRAEISVASEAIPDSSLSTLPQLSSEAGAPRFVKVSASGRLLTVDSPYWACVYDPMTELLWEVKTRDGGWRDLDQSYSWYRPANRSRGTGDTASGVENGGSCLAISCDTHHYQRALEREGLCGIARWRLPTATELQSLDHAENYDPDIEVRYFPNTVSQPYWTATETGPTLAWAVDFRNGFPRVVEKRMAFPLRLVASP